MSDHNARASSLGFSYQPRYALLLLLQSDSNANLFVERFDDIEIQEINGSKKVFELKHKKAGDLSDSSSDLWKTLKIWIDLYHDEKIDLDTTELMIITIAEAKNNSAASKLGKENRDPSKAREILVKFASEATGGTLKEHREAFLQLDDIEQLKLLERIHVLDSSPSVIDLKDEIVKELKHTARKEHREAFFERLEGWWNDQILNHLVNASSTPISAATLEAKVADLREQFFANNLPIDFANLQLSTEKEMSAKEKIFVKQLELIMLTEPRIMHAIYDYYKAYNQRLKWIKDDLIYFDELEKFEMRLIEEWDRRFVKMNEELGTNPDKQTIIHEGRKIYEWVEMDADFCIRPRCTDPYIVRGTYQMLSDDVKIGWHTEFRKQLEHLLIGGRK
ncbi:MAG: hypothetical protein KGI02_06590 [Thaumarchaeota archaeon]|nr:hypothetical protein [Nitrososphaerota archaeon]